MVKWELMSSPRKRFKAVTPVKGILKSRTVLQGAGEFLVAFNEPAIENSWYVYYFFFHIAPHNFNTCHFCVRRKTINSLLTPRLRPAVRTRVRLLALVRTCRKRQRMFSISPSRSIK